MKRLILVAMLVAGCGGTNQTAPDYQGQWAIRFGDLGGTMTITPTARSEITGAWDLGLAGHGEAFGNVEFTTIEVIFGAADHSIVADMNVVAHGDSISGIAHLSTGDVSLTGYRLTH